MATTPCPSCGAALGPFFDLAKLPTSCSCGWTQECQDRRRNKFNAQACVFNGLGFDSGVERDRYIELKLLQTAGQISDLRIHPVYQLSVCKYTADFSYVQDGRLVVEDVKSVVTRKRRDYRRTVKMMKHELGIDVREEIR